MSSLAKLSRLLPSTLQFQPSLVPTIHVSGIITAQTTLHVHQMLQKIPKNKDKIAVLINSQGGCLAQTHIILQKINQIAKRNKAQVWTFAQEWALNAGFLLLASGNQVFVDNCSVVGGVQIGEGKLLTGKLAEYVNTVTYSSSSSYLSEFNSSLGVDPAKKAEVEAIYSQFSRELVQEITRLRIGKIKEGVNLQRLFVGEQALTLGLADKVGRINTAFGVNGQSKLLDKGDIQKWLQRLRKLNISD